MANIQMYVRIRVHDKAGNLVHDHEEESRSLVKAFLAGLLAHMGDLTGGLSGTHDDVLASAETIQVGDAANQEIFRADGLITVDDNGIVIGTTNTAVDITDEKLVAKVVHGTSSGQMEYELQAYPADISISDPDAFFTTSRTFLNNSGGTITVRETGIYATIPQGATTMKDFCIVRDVPTEVAVLNGETCTVDYKFQISE